MPIVFALMASAVLHVSMLLSDGWALPSMNDTEELDVVLVPPPAAMMAAPAVSAVPTAKAPRPMIKPAKKSTLPLPAPVSIAEVSAEPVLVPATATPEPASASTAPAETAPAAINVLAALSRLPAKASWRYTVTRGEGGLLIGEAIYGWEHDGRQYKATSRTETIGIAALFVSAQVTQESAGELDDTGLHPVSYRHVQPKRTDSAELDRPSGVVRNNQRDMSLGDAAARVQDLLSMYYQLGLLLATLDPLPSEIELPLATGRKLESYRFTVLGEERLSRQLNDYTTRHLQARNGRDVIDLWFAPEFPLPLRMRFADRKGDVYEQWLVLPN